MKQNTTFKLKFFLVLSSDGKTGATGKTPAVVLQKGTASFAAADGTVAEKAYGWYIFSGTVNDSDTLGEVAAHITATGCDPVDIKFIVEQTDASDIAAIKSKTDNLPANPANETTVAAVKTKTDNLPSSPANETTVAAVKTKTDNLPASPASETTATAIKSKTDNLPSDPASNTQVNTRLASSAYTAPDNSGITAIKSKTDNLPASPAAVSNIPTAGAIADAICDEALSGHTTTGSVGAALTAAGSASDPWSTSLPGSYGTGTAGKILGGYVAPANSDIAAIKSKTDNLPGDPASNTQVNTRLATAGYTAPDNAGITAIKAKTDNLPASPAAVSNIPTAATIADAICDEALSGHPTAGTVGAALTAAAGDPWSTSLPGSYGNGTAGKIVGSYVAPANSDIAAIKTKTDNLPSDPASNTQVNTRLATSGYTAPANSDISAIKAKTDNLPANPANETTVAAVKTKTDNLPGDPASNTQVNTRLATAGYTAPANSDISAIKAKTDNLPSSPANETTVAAVKVKTDNLPSDPASNTQVNTRLASSAYTAPANSDISAIKAKTDNLPGDPASNTQVNTRLATSAYTAPDNSGITAIKSKTDNLPSDPASNTVVQTRLATAGYTAPDNAGIAAIKAKTDNLPASPAAVSDIPTAIQNADALLTRDVSHVEAVAGVHSVAYVILAMSESDTTSHDGFLTVFRTDGVTEFVRKALQHNSSADWITGIS